MDRLLDLLIEGATVIDTATCDDPQPLAAIDTVRVYGVPVRRVGRDAGARPGRMLARSVADR